MSTFFTVRTIRFSLSLLFLAINFSCGLLEQAVAQPLDWVKLDGPYGGSIWDLEYSSVLGAVAATSGGVYSFDGATQTWRSTGTLRSITTELETKNNSDIYAIAGGGLYEWSSLEGDWVAVDSPDTTFATSVAVSDDWIFLGTREEGLFRSADGGGTWESVGFSQMGVLAVDQVNSAVLVAIEGDGIYRSPDGGETWNRNVNGNFGLFYKGTHRIYTGQDVGDPVCPGTLWVSSDEGLTWQRTTFNCRAIRSVLEISDRLLVGTDDGVFIADAGDLSQWESWDLAGKAVNGLIEMDTRTFAGTRVAGVFAKSSDLGTWTSISSGIAQTRIVRVQPDIYGRVFVGTAGTHNIPGTLCWSGDIGSSWSCVEQGIFDAVGVRAIAVTSEFEFYTGTDAGVFRTNDAGVTWSLLREGIGEQFILDLAVSSDGALWAATQSGIYRLPARDSTWRNLGFVNVFDLEVRNDTVYAATLSDGLLRSTDGGSSWITLLEGISPHRISLVGSNIFVGTFYDGLFRSTDGGSTWSISGFAGENISALAGHDEALFLSTREGVFRSTDMGLSWDFVGFDGREVTDLAFATDGLLYVATNNDGMHRSAHSITSAVEPAPKTDQRKVQAFIFPNPTIGDLNIQLAIETSNIVSLELFNVLGRRVEILYEGLVPSGGRTICVNLRTHPAGIYFIQARSGGHLSTSTVSLHK